MQRQARAHFKHRSFNKSRINITLASREHKRLSSHIRTLCVLSSSVCVLFCVFNQPLAGRRGRIIDSEGEEEEEQGGEDDAGVCMRHDAPKSIKASCLLAFFLLLRLLCDPRLDWSTDEGGLPCSETHKSIGKRDTSIVKTFNIVGSFA